MESHIPPLRTGFVATIGAESVTPHLIQNRPPTIASDEVGRGLPCSIWARDISSALVIVTLGCFRLDMSRSALSSHDPSTECQCATVDVVRNGYPRGGLGFRSGHFWPGLTRHERQFGDGTRRKSRPVLGLRRGLRFTANCLVTALLLGPVLAVETDGWVVSISLICCLAPS